MSQYQATGESSGWRNLRVVIENPAESTQKRQPPSYLVPRTEEQWQSSRLKCGLANSEDILDKITRLERYDQQELQEWEKLVLISATLVDLDVGQAVNTLGYSNVYAGRMSHDTYRRDRAAASNLIRLLDRLYAGLEHRAFELLVIWNIPLPRLRLWTLKDFEELYSKFSEILLEPKEEIQASLALYIPFLVQLVRPQYTLEVIQRALKSEVGTLYDLEMFHRTYRTRNCVPALFRTLGDFRTPHHRIEANTPQSSQEAPAHSGDESSLANTADLARMYPAVLKIHIAGYTTFNVLPELQHKASQADKRQKICNRVERHNTHIIQYDWCDEFHLPVACQVIDDLVRANVLCRTDIFRQKAYLRHQGQLRVETPSLQIIIPTMPPKEQQFVTLTSSNLSSYTFEDRMAWRADRGLILEQGTTLSTTGIVFFISIVMPLKQRQQELAQ